jgi:3-deoxy-D-manno-octulosonic-acid transferase
VQTDEYAARLKELGVSAERIEIVGNIKYDAIDTALKDGERRELRHRLGLPEEVPVLLGGSTHPTEEPELLKAVQGLRKNACPTLHLILVPRHPERTPDVEKDVAAAGFKPVRLSEHRKNPRALLDFNDVLIVDVVGELKGMYKIADAAFIGGSLIPHGGQNIMEPCGLAVPALHGPHMHNFNDAMEILRGCSGALEVTRDSLAAELRSVFPDLPAAQKMAARARAAFLQKQGASARTVEYVLGLMS